MWEISQLNEISILVQTLATSFATGKPDFTRSTEGSSNKRGQGSARVCACAAYDAAAPALTSLSLPLSLVTVCQEEERVPVFVRLVHRKQMLFFRHISLHSASAHRTPATFIFPAEAHVNQTEWGAKGEHDWEEGPKTDCEAAHPPLSLIQPQFCRWLISWDSAPTRLGLWCCLGLFGFLFSWPCLCRGYRFDVCYPEKKPY